MSLFFTIALILSDLDEKGRVLMSGQCELRSGQIRGWV